jgi:hypothetical protein
MTLAELGIRRLASAIQNVLIVRESPVQLYVVDAVSITKASLAVGTEFVSSFHVLRP